MFRFLFQFLLTLSIIQAATATPSICHQGLGTGIRYQDCCAAAYALLTPISHRLARTETYTMRYFSSDSTDPVHFMPHGATHGTCAISLDILSDERGTQTAHATWGWIAYTLRGLITTCVQEHGYGGSVTGYGLAFTVAATHR
jgi:hypothetical protein